MQCIIRCCISGRSAIAGELYRVTNAKTGERFSPVFLLLSASYGLLEETRLVQDLFRWHERHLDDRFSGAGLICLHSTVAKRVTGIIGHTDFLNPHAAH